MKSDYKDEYVSWSCTADLPREFKLGSTDVICEGYDGPDDRYVLKGSCGVEYRLLLTDYGYEKFGYGGSVFGRSSSGSEPGGLLPLLKSCWRRLEAEMNRLDSFSILVHILFGIGMDSLFRD
jgi:SOCE-associated regulatory factor of calcium homoeostasis